MEKEDNIKHVEGKIQRPRFIENARYSKKKYRTDKDGYLCTKVVKGDKNASKELLDKQTNTAHNVRKWDLKGLKV